MTLDETGYVAKVIQRLAEAECAVTLRSGSNTDMLAVSLDALNPQGNRLVLRSRHRQELLERWAACPDRSLDVEVLGEQVFPDCFSVDELQCALLPDDAEGCLILCDVAPSVLITGRAGGVRVPLVLGLCVLARVELYADQEVEIHGRVLDISTGGCRLQIPVSDSPLFDPGLRLHRIVLQFPNGQQFESAAEVRNIRALGESHFVALGLKFVNIDTAADQELLGLVGEAEMEVSYHLGVNSRGSRPSPLFEGMPQSRARLRSAALRRRRTAAITGVADATRTLYIALICLRSGKIFPAQLFLDSASTLCELLAKDRAELLLALNGLCDEPRWIRHAVRLAVMLADSLMAERGWQDDLLDVVEGALLHTLGQPLLQGESLPSLEAVLTDSQRQLLRGHSQVLIERLSRSGWEPSRVARAVVEGCSERLDGSGYPSGRRLETAPEAVQLASLLRMFCALTDPAPGRQPLTPMNAYRWLLERPNAFDRTLVAAVARRYGAYPVGSLVRFSRGFVGWVLLHNEQGLPGKVQIARNMAFPDESLATVLDATDFDQIGEPKAVMNAVELGIPPVVSIAASR